MDWSCSNSAFTVTVRREHCESRCPNHKAHRAEHRIFISHVWSAIHLFNKHLLYLRILSFIEDTSRMSCLPAMARSLVDRCTHNSCIGRHLPCQRMLRMCRETWRLATEATRQVPCAAPTCCGGLNENVLSWQPCSVCGSGTSLLEEVHHRRQASRIKTSRHFQFALSAL